MNHLEGTKLNDVMDKEVPKVKDLLDVDHVQAVVYDAECIGAHSVNRFFGKGARKAPIKKIELNRFSTIACLIGEIKCVERLMSFYENNEIIDGFDPNHDFVQAMYGELCMYILKLDKVLSDRYGVTSSINKDQIEKRSQEYLDRFFHRREKINRLITELDEAPVQ
jgi:hypothetical protein